MAGNDGLDSLPKMGRVNEMCREWLVREDGALAYRLQTEEYDEHLTGNKSRNARLREDFPCALDQQLREQEMAERAAAIYRRMLKEQEEQDELIALELAKRLETDNKRPQNDNSLGTNYVVYENLPPLPTRPPASSLTRGRTSKPMPLPTDVVEDVSLCHEAIDVVEEKKLTEEEDEESQRSLRLLMDQMEIGVPIDEVEERRIQEERDAELARKLQRQEEEQALDGNGPLNPELIRLDRDRRLAMEEQDKELARLLQERERAKARRAKERARQKRATEKKRKETTEGNDGIETIESIAVDDSYSSPIDLIRGNGDDEIVSTSAVSSVTSTPRKSCSSHVIEDENYSSPFDAVGRRMMTESNGSQPLTRPNQLDLRSPLNASVAKTKLIDSPAEIDPIDASSLSSSSSRHRNIAMAIDPTYGRRSTSSGWSGTAASTANNSSVSSCSSASSATATSTTTTISSMATSTTTSSSSPEILADDDSSSFALPYMPIQGQKRTGPNDKKKKKKRTKDGCKQQ